MTARQMNRAVSKRAREQQAQRLKRTIRREANIHRHTSITAKAAVYATHLLLGFGLAQLRLGTWLVGGLTLFYLATVVVALLRARRWHATSPDSVSTP